MNLIGFSHNYTKIHGQTSGTLIAVAKVDYYKLPKEGLLYDVLCKDGHGNKFHAFDIFSMMDECKLRNLVQLTFMGNDMIPFTTYRLCPETKDDSVPYTDLIGQKFAFKFKGEKLPNELSDEVEASKECVKIFA